ncbi:DUF1205 domain-containing protein (plasmid) [Kitasatospora sp. NBC_01302]|nr:DUF1205 domain-containing protein [Kitasatospora sp. NBC_01302]
MNEDGPLAARAVGVPAVYCPPGFFGVNETGHLYLGVPDPAQVFARHGLDPWDRSQVQHIIDPTPVAALPDHGSAVYHASRYVPYNGVGTLPEWEWAQEGRSDRKRVCIIWGRSAIGLFGKEPEALSHAVNASVELGADVVLVVPKEQAGHLGPLPENVRVVQDFPIHLLIRSSDAVVHHSSGNTLMNALALGVPQVALGLSDDAIEVGRRCDRTGASSTLPGFLAGYEEIRSAIARAIDDPSQRHAAEAVRVELEARPDPLRLVRTLEEIAGNG